MSSQDGSLSCMLRKKLCFIVSYGDSFRCMSIIGRVEGMGLGMDCFRNEQVQSRVRHVSRGSLYCLDQNLCSVTHIDGRIRIDPKERSRGTVGSCVARWSLAVANS